MVDLAPDQDEVMAMARYRSNAGLIVAARTLGYLSDSMNILDPTFGKGTFWRDWYPEGLVASDLHPEKSPDIGGGADFLEPPWPPGQFDAVVFDPPYKLNGTPTDEVDERYGVHLPARWQDRMALCEAGIVALAPMTRDWFLIKCQDQVVSGAKRWQTRIFADLAEDQGFRLVDVLHMEGYRVQPPRKCPACDGLGTQSTTHGHCTDIDGARWHDIGACRYCSPPCCPPCPRCHGEGKVRVQDHSRGNYSTLLVLRRKP